MNKYSEDFLLINLYNSSVIISFYENGKLIFSHTKQLRYLKVSNPKKELFIDSLSDALTDLLQKHAVGLRVDNILVVLHGDLSKIKSYELYIKYPDKKVMTLKEITELSRRETQNPSAFKNFIEENELMKVNDIISNIRPGLYKISSWERSKTNHVYFITARQYINKVLHNSVKDALHQTFNEVDIYFANPAILIGSTKNNEIVNSTIMLDFGYENIFVYESYDGRLINSAKLDVSVNTLLRSIERELSITYELAKSELERYVKGLCKGNACKKIKNILDDFEMTLQSNLEDLHNDSIFINSVIAIKNPKINDEVLSWIMSRFTSFFNIHSYIHNNSDLSLKAFEMREILPELKLKFIHNNLLLLG